MVGKAERGPVAIESIKITGGLSDGRRRRRLSGLKGHQGAPRCSAFADLGMEAIYEFDVVTCRSPLAVDSSGTSVHQTGPKEWQGEIGKIPVA